MKHWLIGALAGSGGATSVPTVAEAKRLGGGSSSGMQRNMPARTAPDAPPPKPATPAQPQQAAPATAARRRGAAPAAAAKRSWMGPIAGLAAGLGIAALMSHLGMGEAFGNFLMMALLAVAAIFLVRFVMRRSPAAAPAARPGAGQRGRRARRSAWPGTGGASERRGCDAAPTAASAPGGRPSPRPRHAAAARAAHRAVARAFVPAAFDSEGFSRIAKMIFIRLQAANDSADLDDLRRFTTPEMFAAIRLDIQERGAAAQHTDVRDVSTPKCWTWPTRPTARSSACASTARCVEEAGAAPVDFDEVWHLVKPHDDSRSWAIAGIEQSH